MCVKTVNHLCNKSTCTLQEISLEGGGSVHILCIFKDKEIKACHRFYSTPKQQWYADTVDTVAVTTVCCLSAGILHTNSLQSTLRKQGKRERNKQEEEAGEGGGSVWGGGWRAVLVLKCLWLEGKEGQRGWGLGTGVKFCMCIASPKQI